MFPQKNFHLVGIGGIGMSGLARILRASGKVVTGSDREETPVTVKLREEGITVTIGESAEGVPSATEVVIHTTAAKPGENLELLAAARRGLLLKTYPEALGEITKGKKLIAVTGAHGKSTTTSLIISAALAAGVDISCLVGTNLKELNGANARVGQSAYFVLEACEYLRAFLNLQPEILVVTNIEAEHLDYYRDLADYESAFVELAQKLPASGCLVANSSEANLAKVRQIAPNFCDSSSVILQVPKLKIPGEHNRKNAALALSVVNLLNWDLEKAKQGVASYSGAWRRFELKGELNGAPVYDDYAHHPTEIRATLQGARELYPTSRIIVCYQQHQLDRAARFADEIAASFGAADIVLTPDIYRVRDDKSVALTAQDLAAKIGEASGCESIFTDGFPKTVAWLKTNAKKGDVVFVMGAGDVWRVTESLFPSFKSK